jgi:hypothetical protein
MNFDCSDGSAHAQQESTHGRIVVHEAMARAARLFLSPVTALFNEATLGVAIRDQAHSSALPHETRAFTAPAPFAFRGSGKGVEKPSGRGGHVTSKLSHIN